MRSEDCSDSASPWKDDFDGDGLVPYNLVVKGLRSRQVTLLVGPDKVPLVSMEDYLCTVKFFEAALRGNFKEATTGVIELPEENPDAVAHFLIWLIKGLDFDSDSGCSWHEVDGGDYVVNMIPLSLKWNIAKLTEQCYHSLFRAIEFRLDQDLEFTTLVVAHKSLSEYPARFLAIHALLCDGRFDDHYNRAKVEALLLSEHTDVSFWEDYAKYKILFDMNDYGLKVGSPGIRSRRERLLSAVVRSRIPFVLAEPEFDEDISDSSHERLRPEFEAWVDRFLGL